MHNKNLGAVKGPRLVASVRWAFVVRAALLLNVGARS